MIRYGSMSPRNGHTVAFLRMAAVEARRIAERAPAIADELRYLASQLESEADELAGNLSDERAANC